MTYSFVEQLSGEYFFGGENIYVKSFLVDTSSITVGQNSVIHDLNAENVDECIRYEVAYDATITATGGINSQLYQSLIGGIPPANCFSLVAQSSTQSWVIMLGAPTQNYVNLIPSIRPIVTVWYTKK